MFEPCETAPNPVSSRPAQLPKLGISFDRWRSGRWRAADARPLGRTTRIASVIYDAQERRWCVPGEREVVWQSSCSE